jgi:hypothetical protein
MIFHSPIDERIVQIAWPLILATSRQFFPGSDFADVRGYVNRRMKFDLMNGLNFLPRMSDFYRAGYDDRTRCEYITVCTALVVHATWQANFEDETRRNSQ